MNEAVVWLTIFVLSVFVGIEVISKVSSTLHTPLMSGANAIHGIILLGAILVTGTTDNGVAVAVGLVAIVLAAVNMVGGFVVTDRMLQMFVRKKKNLPPAASTVRGARSDSDLGTARLPGLRGLLHPRAQGPLRPEDRAHRQPDRRGRSRGRVRGSLLLQAQRHRPPAPRAADPGGDRDRCRRWCLRRTPRADDPDAADGGAVQRCRRWGRGPGRAAGAARDRRGRWRHRLVRAGRDGVHHLRGVGVLRRLRGHLRQAAGADDLGPGGVPRPGAGLRGRAARRRGAVHPAGGRPDPLGGDRPRHRRAGLRAAARAPGRWCRRTDRDLAAERLHRSDGGGRRLRAEQRRTPGGRHAGRGLGYLPDPADGPRHGPLGRQHPLRRPQGRLHPRQRASPPTVR